MYVELHCHSAYSFLDGASQPEELAARAAELGYEALALTDHDGVYGSLELAHAAKALGVRPITGAEVTLEGGAHLTLLVETPQGYANLCRLLTAAHAGTREGREPRPPALDPTLLEIHGEGLVCLSGCARDGLAVRDPATAARVASVFGRERFYVELQREPLRDTHGVVVFQDQVLAVATALAGFSVGEAEGLRRAMSRKRSRDALEAYRARFVEGAGRKGGDGQTADRVYDKLVGFSGFGFPKSHAAAFGLLAYQSAWLRHHYPAEVLCALLNAQPMGFYPPAAFVRDAQRRGVEVRSPGAPRSSGRGWRRSSARVPATPSAGDATSCGSSGSSSGRRPCAASRCCSRAAATSAWGRTATCSSPRSRASHRSRGGSRRATSQEPCRGPITSGAAELSSRPAALRPSRPRPSHR